MTDQRLVVSTFWRTGINLNLIAVSGQPFTRNLRTLLFWEEMDFWDLSMVQENHGLSPMDLRLDRSFNFKGGQSGRGLSGNIYLRVQNVLNAKNVRNVFGYTGDVENDGYLLSEFGQDRISDIQNSGKNVDAFWMLIHGDWWVREITFSQKDYLGVIFNYWLKTKTKYNEEYSFSIYLTICACWCCPDDGTHWPAKRQSTCRYNCRKQGGMPTRYYRNGYGHQQRSRQVEEQGHGGMVAVVFTWYQNPLKDNPQVSSIFAVVFGLVVLTKAGNIKLAGVTYRSLTDNFDWFRPAWRCRTNRRTHFVKTGSVFQCFGR